MPEIFGLVHDIGSLLEVVGTIFWIWMLIDCFNRAKARPQRAWLVYATYPEMPPPQQQ